MCTGTLLESFISTNVCSIIAHNGSVFAEAHRMGSRIYSSGSSPSSTSPPPAATAIASESAITTTRSLRTQAITYATAYLSYLRDLRPDDGSVSASPASSNMSSSDYLEGEPITYESRKSPSVAIISPVGDKILLAVTGEFNKPKESSTDGESSGQNTETAEGAATAATTETATSGTNEDDLAGAKSTGSNIKTANATSTLDDPDQGEESSSTGRLTPPHDLIETLKEVSESLAERLRAEFQGMRWPSDL